MSLMDTPVANRTHIGFFGCRNVGKSSLVNAVTGQDLCVVSDVKGTTTDPVSKTMELLPLGPVVIIDTPGLDDEGVLGEKRMDKAQQVLNKTDIAVVVVDGSVGLRENDRAILSRIREKKIPYLLVRNKSDLAAASFDEEAFAVSARTGEGIYALKEKLASLAPQGKARALVYDLLPEGGTAVLVVPIDKAAPKGRLILPQQQVLRDLLDHGQTAFVARETELRQVLSCLKEAPSLVVTDSQAFETVAEIVPESIPLTSFSILMARYKGFLETALECVRAVDALREGDRVLIAEGCTHHRQCNDIGTVKIPRWLREHTGKSIVIETCSGTEFPRDLTRFAAIIHCGGCMLNEREVQHRCQCAINAGVPFINYGTLIAHMTGILERSIKPLENARDTE